MHEYDIAIVGAGLAGAATAAALAERGGRSIVCLEKEPVPGVHASGRNAALIRRLEDLPALGALAREGAAAIEQGRLVPSPAPRRPHGALLLARGPEWAALQRSADAAEAAGVSLRRLTPAEARERVPLLRRAKLEGAILSPRDGVVDVAHLLHGYLETARRAGVEVRFRQQVRAIEPAPRGRLRLETPRGPLIARTVVNAAGPWAETLGRMAGAQPIRLTPKRRHLYVASAEMRPSGARAIDDAPSPLFALSAAKPSPNRAPVPLALPLATDAPWVWDETAGYYFRPESGGVLLCACDEDDHPPGIPTVDPSVEVQLAEKLSRWVPELTTLPIRHRWAGLRTFAPDRSFVIGWDRKRAGFFWVAGLGGHGVTTSAAVGALAARLLEAGLRAGIAPPALDPGRFA